MKTEARHRVLVRHPLAVGAGIEDLPPDELIDQHVVVRTAEDLLVHLEVGLGDVLERHLVLGCVVRAMGKECAQNPPGFAKSLTILGARVGSSALNRPSGRVCRRLQ